jgi:hypothetical protein
MVSIASPTAESNILSQLVVPDGPPLAAEFAGWLLGIHFTSVAEDQIRELLAKNKQGTIGEDERSLLDKYLSLGGVLDVLQTWARSVRLREQFASVGPSTFEAFQRIVEITTEVFGQAPKIKHDYNPEFPSEKYIVLTVEVPFDRKSVLDMEAEWTQMVAVVEPKLDTLRLSIEPRK